MPSSNHYILFWNGNGVNFHLETDLSFLVWRKQNQHWLLNSLSYLPPYLPHSMLPTTLPFSTSVPRQFLVGGKKWWLQCTLNLWKVLESRTAPWNFFWTKGAEAPKSKKQSWPIFPSLPRTFSVLALKGPHPYKHLSCEQTEMTGLSGVNLFSYLTLAFYLPQIYLKFCLKQNLFLFSFSERGQNY